VYTFQEQIEAYKAKKKAIDAAPIKKVAEAKARKKRKVSAVNFRCTKDSSAECCTVQFIMYKYFHPFDFRPRARH